jgi:hypothetical protein
MFNLDGKNLKLFRNKMSGFKADYECLGFGSVENSYYRGN